MSVRSFEDFSPMPPEKQMEGGEDGLAARSLKT
jgi:hypothetical protein